jgi:DNA repair exonuclease SbcCD nuclease subunit
MKIAICSDVHLEFGQLTLKNTENAEVLILSGDICTACDLLPNDDRSLIGTAKSNRYHEFFSNCSSEFHHVVYIAGNHEHYHGDYAETLKILKQQLAYLGNVHVLDKEVFDLNDYRFIGGTLWTNMNDEDEMTMQHVQHRMNDFRICENSNNMVNYRSIDKHGETIFRKRPGTLSPADVVEEHKAMMKFIEDTYTNTPPWITTIVVGHHAPSKLSEHPRYKQDVLMNGAYNSNLDQFILDRPGIKLWTHGHTHEDFDYMIGSTRVICNPRGYIDYEDRADRFELKVVEV